MKYIEQPCQATQRSEIRDRFASIYATQLPGYRDGDSCPVVFHMTENKYHGYFVSEVLGGLRHCHRPQACVAQVVAPGTRSTSYSAAVSGY